MSVKIITLEELNKHNRSQNLWIAIADKVYDCSKFADVVSIIWYDFNPINNDFL